MQLIHDGPAIFFRVKNNRARIAEHFLSLSERVSLEDSCLNFVRRTRNVRDSVASTMSLFRRVIGKINAISGDELMP
jgi:hypothetical protein